MKKTALLSILCSLVISLAVPPGTAFASEDLEEVALSDVASMQQESGTSGELEMEPSNLNEESSPEQLSDQESEVSEPPLDVDEPSSVEPPEPPVIQTPPTAPVVTEPVTTPPLIVTTFDVSDGIEFIELYNQSDAPIAVSEIRIQARAGEQICATTIADQGYILPGEFFYVRSPTYVPGHFDRQFASECLLTTTLTRLELFVAGSRVQLIDGIALAAGSWGGHSGTWSTKSERKNFTTLKQAGSFAGHYLLVAANPGSLYSSNAYAPPGSAAGLKIVELLPNSRSCSPDDLGVDCDDYIKVYNDSTDDINLAMYRLRLGSRTANATVTTSFNWHEPTLHPARDELLLPAGQYFTLKLRNDGAALALSNSESNVWLEDYFGVVSYQSMSYKGMDLAGARGKSWAYNLSSDIWQFGIPSPYGANVLYVPVEEPGKGVVSEGLKSCGPGQYRSEETNRCRNIAVSSALKPCREGQYRSEETNRCRSIALAVASVLKPCAEGQFRNPETNRCRKIASAEDIALADCGEGRERNPETNRCRNVALAGSLTDTMPFPVDRTDAGVERFAGWWTLGIITIIGAGYGAWEWREELAEIGRRAGRFITRAK